MSGDALSTIFRALDEAQVRYLVVGGVAVVLHGHLRFTADLDLVLDLDVANTRAAVAALESLQYQARAPVPLTDFANAKIRNTWVDDKGLMVFSLWSPAHPGTEVDLFVEEPFDFDEAWERRMDAVLPDGTTVHVVGFADLQLLKRNAGRPRDLYDLESLQEIARARLEDDDQDA
ncbi:MAG: DUF6036 family nucleotidyltransferase [Polyangiales bacterium]